MSEPINDGGGAFPTPYGVQHNDGMTMRDYFAALVCLAGIVGLSSDRFDFATPRSWIINYSIIL